MDMERSKRMLIAVLNAGSATIKAALIDSDGKRSREMWRESCPLDAETGAAPVIAGLLEQIEACGLTVDAVGHRIVHGGTPVSYTHTPSPRD